MRQVDVLLIGDMSGALDPFVHDDLRVSFHRYQQWGERPFFQGALWAFVDWTLTDISGLEMCRRLRCDPFASGAHITMVLGEHEAEDRGRALRAGADDYLVGPLTRQVVLDRVMATQLPGYTSGTTHAIQLGDLRIVVAAHQARWRNTPIALTPSDFRLLRFFAEHPGQIFTRFQLIAALGKHEPPLDERTVDVWVGRLRRALRKAGVGDPLRTVRSLGYVFDNP